jgi:hypothetical protein
MNKDEELEYILLRNYLELTDTSRGLLLKMDFDALNKIDSNTWLHKFEGDEIDKQKRIVKSIIQQEIIAKIMIYIEDLAIISESLLRGVNYYSLLDKKETSEGIQDVGDILKKFFENIDQLSESDFAKIMSYGQPNDYAINDEEKQLLEKALQFEKEEYYRIFKILKDFGSEHHAVFRRYKHAGFPMAPGLRLIEPLPKFLKNFDFISYVSVKNDPFDEPRILPFSDKVIESYHIIIHGIQDVLKDVISNKKSEIQRRKKLPPICWHTAFKFSLNERKKFEAILQRHIEQNPPTKTEFNINITTTEQNGWYSKLDEFLEECKKIKNKDSEYKKSLSE